MYYKGDVLSRVANKLKREVLRLPGVRVLQGYAHFEALEAHSLRLPPLDPRDLPALEGLRRTGVHTLRIDSLGFPETGAAMAALDKLVAELREMPAGGDNQPRISAKRLMDFPEVYLWGLNERLLNLVENYIGLPIWYHGVDVRREVADGKTSDVRQWHMDAEDRRMFRAIVYLNDVEPGGGPFEYIPRERSAQGARKLHYGSGFVTDAEMTAAIPPSQWVEVTKKAHSAVFADTCSVFHRAQAARHRDRYSITFSWTSRTPLKTYPTAPLSDTARAFVTSHTNERQRSALPGRSS